MLTYHAKKILLGQLNFSEKYWVFKKSFYSMDVFLLAGRVIKRESPVCFQMNFQSKKRLYFL